MTYPRSKRVGVCLWKGVVVCLMLNLRSDFFDLQGQNTSAYRHFLLFFLQWFLLLLKAAFKIRESHTEKAGQACNAR